MPKVIFLNCHKARNGFITEDRLPHAYRLTAKFFDSGVIDRTGTLETGFDYTILDPLNEVLHLKSHLTFAEICDQVAHQIVDEALSKNTNIQVLWSGGIDSTVALIGLIKACREKGCMDILEILLTLKSINEYPLFYNEYINHKLKIVPIAPPISRHFDEAKLIVTGEHGDQLFGSDKLKPLIENKTAFLPYEEIIPIVLIQKLGGKGKAKKVMDYLAPQLAKCPFPIRTAYDLMWWMNISMKWQQVTLRLAVFRGEKVKETYESIRHFFRDKAFQIWSFNNHDKKIIDSWGNYKYIAKEYIYAFTKDEQYLNEKTKEPSLKSVILNRKKRGDRRYRILMREDFQPQIEVFLRQNRIRNNQITEKIAEK